MTKKTRSMHKFMNAARAMVGSRRYGIPPQRSALGRLQRWGWRLVSWHNHNKFEVEQVMRRVS